jgi:hypothetical protein
MPLLVMDWGGFIRFSVLPGLLNKEPVAHPEPVAHAGSSRS